MSSRHHLSVRKTATYFTLGNPQTAKTIWFVLHGYGMLAEFFIRKFEPLVNEDTAVIAPEGLSRFYTQGFYGRVGASWMTKEGREHEITDYINYLNQLYSTLISSGAGQKINVVGFSQGGATASRWIADHQSRIDNFILWSSIFPDDMSLENFGKNFKAFIVYGTEDEFARPEHFTQQQNLFTAHQLDVVIEEFVGPHDIPKDIILELTQKHGW
ncbi:MAG: alpha/beta fold hydrolase [Flavobacteriales bacterium]|nr:alpha/beta fold hydrolase [Flavobacteriales bacterium]